MNSTRSTALSFLALCVSIGQVDAAGAKVSLYLMNACVVLAIISMLSSSGFAFWYFFGGGVCIHAII